MASIKRLLLFEPDTNISQMLVSGFQIKSDYRVDFCSNFFQFGQKIDNFCPDYYGIVLAADVLMKQVDPKFILENIRDKNPFVKIILTSFNETPDLIKFINMKLVDDILSKGATAEDITKSFERPVAYSQTSFKPITTTNNFNNVEPEPKPNFQQQFSVQEQNINGGEYMAQNNGFPNGGFPPQGMPNQGQPNQGFPQQFGGGYPQQNMGQQMPQGMPNQGFPQQGMMQGMQPQNIPQMQPQNIPQMQPQNIPQMQTGMPPQGMQNQGFQQSNNFPQQNMGQQMPQGMPNQNFGQSPMPQGIPPYGQPPMQGGMPPQGMNMGMQGGMPMQHMPQKVIRVNNKTVITVHSPKGGVGKSTISKELSVTYALSAQSQGMRVCLVDMNIDYGNISIMLDIKPIRTMASWARDIARRCDNAMQTTGNLDKSSIKYTWEEIENTYLLRHNSGLYILAAPTNHRDAGIIGDIEAEIMIENLKNHFDILIIDTGPDIKDVTFVSLDKADHLLLVCNMEVPTLSDLDQLAKTLRTIGYDFSKVSVVMNETSPQQEAEALDLIRYLNFDRLVGIVPKSRQVVQYNDNGTAMSQSPVDNNFTIAIKQVANNLCPIVKAPTGAMQKRAAAESKEKKGFSLFGKKK